MQRADKNLFNILREETKIISMFLTIFWLAATLSSADNLCKQFGPRSGQNVGPYLDPLHSTLLVLLKEFYEKK